MSVANQETRPADWEDEDDGPGLTEALAPWLARWKLLLIGSVLGGVLGAAGSYLIQPQFTAKTTFLPPAQSQGGAAAALASLGSLGSLIGGGAVRSTGDQYVALMQSVTVSDRLIDKFNLMAVYDRELRVDARKDLAKQVRISFGKKDGLITVEVEDKSPQRAADMANQYVNELRRVSSQLAVSEAQQRRMFFESQLQATRDRLAGAQQALEASGIAQGALKAEPKAAAEGYAKLRAELTAAEVRLQVLRNALTDSASEVRQQQSAVSALRAQLGRLAQPQTDASGPDYISRFREFKYQETLFELYARQFELARADEAREGALIQVVDTASAPERKSFPKRSLVALATAGLSFAALALLVWVRRPRTDLPVLP